MSSATDGSASDWIAVAALVRVRGNRGELTAISLSSKPERFAKLKAVRVVSDRDAVSYEVEEVWQHSGDLVFKFRGIDSISDAEKLRRRLGPLNGSEA